MKRSSFIVVLTLVGLFGLSAAGIFSSIVQAQTLITPEQAEQAALDACPGTVVEPAQLAEEEGHQVYKLVIEAADGSGQFKVTVDAETGQVIYAEPYVEQEAEDPVDVEIISPKEESQITGKSLTIVARVTNRSNEKLQNIPITFQFDGRRIESKTLSSLKAGRSKKLSLRVKLNTAPARPAAQLGTIAQPLAAKVDAIPGVHFVTVFGQPASAQVASDSVQLNISPSSRRNAEIALSQKHFLHDALTANVQLFDLNGKLLSQEIVSGENATHAQSVFGKPLPQGVYLYAMTTFGSDGTMIRKEVRKLIVR